MNKQNLMWGGLALVALLIGLWLGGVFGKTPLGGNSNTKLKKMVNDWETMCPVEVSDRWVSSRREIEAPLCYAAENSDFHPLNYDENTRNLWEKCVGKAVDKYNTEGPLVSWSTLKKDILNCA